MNSIKNDSLAKSTDPIDGINPEARYKSGFRDSLFLGKAFIVTGGGSGIGRCIALEIAALGGSVGLVGRDIGKLERVQREIVHDGGKAEFWSCDIRDEAAVAETVTASITRFGHIDGLVNCAGGQFPAPLRDISLKGWNAVVANNTSNQGGHFGNGYTPNAGPTASSAASLQVIFFFSKVLLIQA